MAVILTSFVEIIPVFLLICLGFILRKIRFVDAAFLNVLSRFVFYILIPPFMFMAFVGKQFGSAFSPQMLFPTMTAVVLVACGSYFLIGSRLRPAQRGAFTQGASRSNLVLVGLPILINLYGDAILIEAIIFIVFHALLNNVLAVLFLLLPHHSRRKQAGWRQMAAQIILNPVILGCAAAMAFAATGLTLPKPIEYPLTILSNALLPLALILVGASLERTPHDGQLILTGTACMIKLILLPAAALALLDWVGVRGTPVIMALILLGSPTATISQIMAKEMAGDERLASNIITSTILLSPLTLAAWIGLLS